MGMLDFVTGPLRSLLGVAEATEAGIERHAPTAQLEARLDDAVAAVHRAADSMERHVAVVESLADSLPLTQSVTRLTDQLTELMKITAPVAAAEPRCHVSSACSAAVAHGLCPLRRGHRLRTKTWSLRRAKRLQPVTMRHEARRCKAVDCQGGRGPWIVCRYRRQTIHQLHFCHAVPQL